MTTETFTLKKSCDGLEDEVLEVEISYGKAMLVTHGITMTPHELRHLADKLDALFNLQTGYSDKYK